MFTAMLLFAAIAATPQPAPDLALVQELHELAYIAGRCNVWFDDITNADIKQSMIDTGAQLIETYLDGIEESGQRIEFEICEREVNRSLKRLINLRKPINFSADATTTSNNFIGPSPQ